ncbi:MAG: hypothetical protein LBR29_11950 [Methylobacteriaceae bacterium]|jgi:uncharacterized membrane protein YkvI|nr:hypothetical protein [Methylobacteriaceae bacterium]
MNEKTSIINVIKFGGAFVAFIIGSGFATGQEIMQFFSAFGINGIYGAFISMALFVWTGVAIMCRGFDAKNDPVESAHPFDHWFIFSNEPGTPLYWVGKVISTVFEWFIPFFLFLVVCIMFSGAGATVDQYYGLGDTELFGIPFKWGCVFMAAVSLISVLFGLRRIIDIIGTLGPLTIFLTIFIAVGVLLQDSSGLAKADAAVAQVGMNRADGLPISLWWFAGILYVAYNVTGSVPFMAAMGANAKTRNEAFFGSIAGGVALMLAGVLLVAAHLAYAGEVGTADVPNLILADKLTGVLRTIFAVVLVGEIYSTAAPMLWVATDQVSKGLGFLLPEKLTKEGTIGYAVVAIALTLIAYVVSLSDFWWLVGFIYPKMGYVGIFFFLCIAARQIYGLVNKKG